MKKILLLTLLTVFLAACGVLAGGAEPPGGTWRLVSMPGFDHIPVQVTLRFDSASHSVAGNAGCNSYSGGYSLQGSRLSIDENLVMTLMACPDQDWNEADFIQSLTTASAFSVQGEQLLLDVDGGQMVFVPAAE